jgi:hypothetical protein
LIVEIFEKTPLLSEDFLLFLYYPKRVRAHEVMVAVVAVAGVVVIDKLL